MTERTGPLRGRQAEAARNDRRILDAARNVFMRDPHAPISAVAVEAGVGVGALYRRYASKEVLLQTLCSDGLERFIAIAEEAAADNADPWSALARFIEGIVDADVHSLTVHLAGTFTPTEAMRELAASSNRHGERIFRRARSAGVIRADVHLNDIVMVFEQLAAVRLGDADRTRALRRRYLTLHLDAMRAEPVATKLPGRAPTGDELGARWIPEAAGAR
jgi:AcrR family transcriptional regulator